MKFDVIVMNPPYNPNSLWKKFTLKAIEWLKEDGQMVSIHPDSWRTSSKHNKLCQHLKEHILELHITDFNSFPGVAISTDWYVYNKQKQNNCEITYPNKQKEILKLNDRILRFSSNSIQGSIISKLCTLDDNGAIMLNGFDTTGAIVDMQNGTYLQCGGYTKMSTKWCIGQYVKTINPTKHQNVDKIVMSYTQKPRSRFISAEENIGILRAYYWLTDNKSLPILLNSKMIWKLGQMLTAQIKYTKTTGVIGFNRWFLKSLNFDGLTATTEEELYEHYDLTEEEINFCES